MPANMQRLKARTMLGASNHIIGQYVCMHIRACFSFPACNKQLYICAKRMRSGRAVQNSYEHVWTVHNKRAFILWAVQ